MADYVKKPILYKRVRFTGDVPAFLDELAANTNAWWQWAVFEGSGDAILLQYQSNVTPPTYLQIVPDQFVVFRDSPDEMPYVDPDGSTVVPA